EDAPSTETLRVLHRTIADVRTEMSAMRINTAIAKMIVLNNHLTSLEAVPRAAVEPLVLMVAPVAPHIAEELWSRLGHEGSLLRAPFPVADEQYLVEDTVTCVLQVAGKVRGRVEVSPDVSEDELREIALADPGVRRHLDGREVRKVIVRAPKRVNVVPAEVFSRVRPARVAVVTDSTASVPPELVAEHQLTVVPLDVVIDGARHVEGEGDTARLLVEALEAGTSVTTSQPAPAAFARAYAQAARAGAREIVSV